jgi:hypothetical protein
MKLALFLKQGQNCNYENFGDNIAILGNFRGKSAILESIGVILQFQKVQG